MPLGGHALLVLWNDVRRDREVEYDRWHTVEHVPERVAVPGFLGGRRYVDRTRQRHRYFTLYELESLAALDTDEYRDLVANPTPWSASMRPDFANFVRVPASVVASDGDGIGAAVAVMCVAGQRVDVPTGALVKLDGVVAAHYAHGEPARGPGTWQAAGAVERAFDALLLVETFDRASAERVLREVAPRLGLDGSHADFGAAVYDLAFALPGDVAVRERHRRAHWARPA
jgi:hypothetical protein